MAKFHPIAIIDTREQHPFVFDNIESRVETLQTGDYSVLGLEKHICAERKSLPDMLACVGRDRERFKRELDRILAHRFRLLVIECSIGQIEEGDWRSKVLPASVLGSLAAWTAQYTLPVWLGGTHEQSGRFVERFLFQSARCICMEHRAMTS